MIIKAALAAAALALLACSGAAVARDQIGGRDPVTIDPQRAYIFYRISQRVGVRFLREVTPDQLSAWLAERAEALSRARRRRPDLTEAAFTFAPPELRNFVTVARGPQFGPDPNGSTYLIAVPPGTYVLYGVTGVGLGGGPYGQIAGAMGSAIETCLCMGSVRFEARAGQIVDIGQIRFPSIEDEDEVSTRRLASLELRPVNRSMVVPDRLRGLPLVQAELRAADKMPNYFGIQIDRHPPVRGILDYRRDRVIDVRTASPAAPAR